MSEPAAEKAALPRQPSSWWRLQLMRLIDVALTATISAALTCLFLLVAALVFSMKESGSAVDWLAALFNGVVAIAAVAAFIVARSWLPQLTTQEGYKLAIELVNDHYICLGIQNSVLTDVSLPVSCIRHQYDRKSMSGSPLTIGELVNTLGLAVQQHKTRWDKMDQIRFRLGTYGLRVSGAFEDRFQELDNAYQAASDAAESILETLKNTHDLHKKHPSTDSELHFQGELIREMYMQYVDMANEQYAVVNKQYQLMADIHKRIFSSCPSIGQLFEVRK